MKDLLLDLKLTIEAVRRRIDHESAEKVPYDIIESDITIYERLLLLYRKCHE